MSRAFVKEDDSDSPAQLPELPLSPHPNLVTARGLQLLRQRLSQNLHKQDGLAALTTPDQALQQAELAREQRWLQARIASAQLRVPPTQPKRVEFGCLVELIDEHEQQHRYRLVGEDEAAPEHGRISWLSPLATALLGAEPGDEKNWPRPAGNLLVEVVAIDGQPESESAP